MYTYFGIKKLQCDRSIDIHTEVKKFVESQNFVGVFRDHQVARSLSGCGESDSLICWRIVLRRVNAPLARYRRGRLGCRERDIVRQTRAKSVRWLNTEFARLGEICIGVFNFALITICRILKVFSKCDKLKKIFKLKIWNIKRLYVNICNL